jgi:translocation and assembly module TamB
MDQLRRPRAKRSKRVLRIAGRSLVALVVFVLAVPVLGLFALRFGGVRAFVAKRVDSALASSFRGRIHLRELHRVDLTGARASGSVDDPGGHTVVRFEDAAVNLNVPALLVRLLRDHGSPSVISVESVALRHAEIRLIDDGQGAPTLADTFAPRTPSPPSTTPAPRVELHHIDMKHLWVHGALASTPWIDVDLSGLTASLLLDAKALRLELERVKLDERFEPFNPHGSLNGKLVLPLGDASPTVSGGYHGTVAGTELEATGSFENRRLSADVTLPSVDAAAIQRFAPDLALVGSVHATAHATGPLDNVALSAEVEGDAVGAVRVAGTARVTAPEHAALEIELSRVNAAALAPTAPSTLVDANATLDLNLESERWRAKYELVLTSAVVSGQKLPSMETHGSAHGQGSNAAVDGEASIHEVGSETDIAYRVSAAGSHGHAEAGVKSRLEEPPRLVRLAGVRTSGTLDARASFDWPKNVLDATAELHLGNVQHSVFQTGATSVKLTAKGSVARPAFTADVSVRSLSAFERDFDTARVFATGTPADANVRVRLTAAKGQGLSAHAQVKSENGVTELVGPALAFTDADGALAVSARQVTIAAGDVAVERGILDGAGHANASFSLRRRRLELEAHTRELDLGRLVKLAGLSSPVKEARATLDVRYAGSQGGQGEGSVRGTITDIGYGRITGGWASMDLALAKGGGVSGMFETELVQGAKVVVGIDDIVPAELASARSWAPSGRVRVSGKLDLTCMSPLIGATPSLPIEDVKGTVDLDVAYARADVDAFPELKAHVKTHGLTLVGRREIRSSIDTPKEAIAAAPAVYRGADVAMDVGLDARNPRLVARGELYDEHGSLLELDASAGPWLNENLTELAAGLRAAPIEVKASMPARKLRLLPGQLRPQSLRGTIAWDLTLDGSIANPHLVLDARASRLSSLSERIVGDEQSSVSVLAHSEYRRSGGKVELVARRDKQKAVDAQVSWTGDALLAATSAEERQRLTFKADAVLDALDLGAIPALKNRQIEGVVSGTTHVEYAADRRVVSADLAAHPLRVGQASMDRVNVLLAATATDVKGLVLVRGKSGSLDAQLTSGLTWPAGGTPALAGSVRASLAARQFRLATLSPMLGSAVNELDGKLDADLSATVQGDNVELRGKGRLADGVVQLPSIGQRFEAISANIEVEPAVLVLRDLAARGLTGGLEGNARIEIDQHLALKQATAELAIPKHQKLPLTVQGVALGDAWGRIQARIVNHPDKVEVAIKVPELHLFVADSGGGDVQDLAPDPQVRVGFRRSDAKFVALAVQPLAKPSENPTPLDLTLELGNVSLKRGDLVTADVTGKLQVHVDDKTSVTGEIDVKGGTLDVSGKRFDIERGSVTFTGGEPSNPTVSAVARWDAPAGYAVYATYTGTAKQGSLTLRAEPPLSQAEILNLIMFGTPEGSVTSGSGDTATSALGVAGGTATKGINRALSDFTHLDIQARIDTSTGDSRPELMVPVSKVLSARLTRAVGEPPPGQSPDRTFVTLELRLKQFWALSAMIGDRGASALDLVWRRHY